MAKSEVVMLFGNNGQMVVERVEMPMPDNLEELAGCIGWDNMIMDISAVEKAAEEFLEKIRSMKASYERINGEPR